MSRRERDVTLECRNLLRSLRNPEGLGRNALASEVFPLIGWGPDQHFVLSDLVSRALQRLEPQDRAIVQRCDINEEPFAEVAQGLGISERHLYRKRRPILERLAEAIVEGSRDVSRIYVEAASSICSQLRTSRVLEENGN